MTCQDFRRHWIHDIDNADVTHLETCDDCLNWIEANVSSEEVMFMKEFPQPSPQLEDRIMQAIYQLTPPQAVPPVTATVENAPVMLSAKRKPKHRYLQMGWAGAAAVIIAFGLFSVQGVKEQATDIKSEQPQESSTVQGTPNAAAPPAPPQTPEIAVAEKQPEIAASKEHAASTTNETAPAPATGETVQAKEAPANTPLMRKIETPAASKQEAPAQADHNSVALTKESDLGISAATALGPLPARGKDKAADSAAVTESAADTEVKSNAKLAAPAATEENSMTMAGIIADHAGAPSIAAMPAADTESAQSNEQITLSTFTDVDTARQASDLPVPNFKTLPEGFTLSSVSLRYESETSKHVESLAVQFMHRNNQIKIEVSQAGTGKHSLSVPGTFTETQVFQVDGERAIGVTYDPAAYSGIGTAQHEVQYYKMNGNNALHVVITANGITLKELTELAKQMNWSAQ